MNERNLNKELFQNRTKSFMQNIAPHNVFQRVYILLIPYK